MLHSTVFSDNIRLEALDLGNGQMSGQISGSQGREY
jgi:hypothetical protein